MGVRVIADDMAARGGLFQEVRTFARVFSDHKKSRASLVAVKKIEQLRRDCRIRPVVKRESKLLRRIRPADRPAKELRTRIGRSVGGASRCGSRQTCWPGDQPGIHRQHSRTL